MGVFGAGNSGSALTKFVAPALIVAAGGSWSVVPQVYSVAMLVTALVFWQFSATNPAHNVSSTAGFREQLNMLKDPRVWRYCQYYSVVFGGYVALALWMTKYYVGEYGFSLSSAAFLAACFLAAWRRAARHRRLDLRQVRCLSNHLVGDVGVLGVPSSSSAIHKPNSRCRPINGIEHFRHRPVADHLHHPALHRRRRHCRRQGLGIQVHRRRLQRKHRRRVRHRRPRRRSGRFHPAHPLRCTRRSHRRALQLLHVALRHRLRLPRLDALQLPSRRMRRSAASKSLARAGTA